MRKCFAGLVLAWCFVKFRVSQLSVLTLSFSLSRAATRRLCPLSMKEGRKCQEAFRLPAQKSSEPALFESSHFYTWLWWRCFRENETLKSVGEKTSSAIKRTGTVIKDTGSTVGSKISGAATTLKVYEN